MEVMPTRQEQLIEQRRGGVVREGVGQAVHSMGCKARKDSRSSRLEEVCGHNKKVLGGKGDHGQPLFLSRGS